MGLPLTEEQYLALGETPDHVELFDGGLYFAPPSTPRHQYLSSRLVTALSEDTLTAFRSVNVRLRPGWVVIPDVVVTTAIDVDELVIDAGSVRLIGEVVSPFTAAIDQVLKWHLYAAHGIRWYLLADEEAGTLRLNELSGGSYHERSVTQVGDVLRLTEPIAATISPEDLLPPR